MEHLKIINFGAVESAEIEIKKYNIFIGDTSSGKSTVAKLITIFNSFDFYKIKENDFESFFDLLERYNICFAFEESTIIEYNTKGYFWKISKNKFHTNYYYDDYNDADLIELGNEFKFIEFIKKYINKEIDEDSHANFLDPIILKTIYNNRNPPMYIPAERILISTFTNSIFSLLQAGINIPTCIKDFGSAYEKARTYYSNIDIDIMNISVSFSKAGDTILLKDDNSKIRFSQSSSGMQSVIPLWTVFNQYVKDNNGDESEKRRIIIIEEPELNLFPTTQVALMEWMMGKMKKSKGSIVITTHSPYILSAIDNLILANEVATKATNNKDKKRLKKLEKLLPSMALVDFNEVSSYLFSSNGIVKDIADKELKLLGAEYIDEASNKTSKLFNDLCKLEDDEL
ncbi:hypothetical protein Barb6_00526 [Bacteroidales bacterium Barb6]|nr:hypothetical protein Barb6_00526 [Bacteroidales bacterium Barb6]